VYLAAIDIILFRHPLNEMSLSLLLITISRRTLLELLLLSSYSMLWEEFGRQHNHTIISELLTAVSEEDYL
jgi:hypothetical protein